MIGLNLIIYECSICFFTAVVELEVRVVTGVTSSCFMLYPVFHLQHQKLTS